MPQLFSFVFVIFSIVLEKFFFFPVLIFKHQFFMTKIFFRHHPVFSQLNIVLIASSHSKTGSGVKGTRFPIVNLAHRFEPHGIFGRRKAMGLSRDIDRSGCPGWTQ